MARPERPSRAGARFLWEPPWRRMLLVLALLANSFAAMAAPTDAAVRIGVATMQPGEIFWERFGHNAIVVDDPARDEPLSYNFGFFDLSEPGFVGRFVRGEMEYMLVAMPFAQDLRYYRDTGRGVSIQWLDLPPDRARALADALAVNAQPENARYRYDYFTDNCSTRVRDALDDALDGALRERLDMPGTGSGTSFRSEAIRLASPAGWMWLGFDLGLGPRADVPLSAWQEGFVPMRLADSLRGASTVDGRPLVASEQLLLPHRAPPEPTGTPRPWWPHALAGLLLGIGIVAAGRRWPRAVAGTALPFWIACGVVGALLLFIWCCTAHWSGWENHNLLVYGPLCLLAVPGGWRLARGRAPGRWFGRALALIAVAAGVALVLHVATGAQENLRWIALLLPVHAALWLALGRKHDAPG